MLKDKRILIGVIAVVILLIGGAFFVFGSKSQTSTTQQEQSTDENIPSIKPEEIGLDFTASEDKKYVKFVINKPDGIESIEYEITYDAISEDGQTINQGLTGSLSKDDIKNGKLETKYRELGTCSTGGKCRFDNGVKEVKLVLKITKGDGKVYQTEKTLSL